MNQIIYNIKNEKSNKPVSTKKALYAVLFWLFVFLSLCFVVIYFFKQYIQSQNEIASRNLANNFKISTLYSNSTDYSTSLSSDSNTFVIGILKIDKIKLVYPILSNCSDELLNISLCRFYGPNPNKPGNICIAGHNYIDTKMFGRLSELNVGDTFEIFDSDGTSMTYKIFDKFEVSADDLSCTNQDSNTIEATLVTCNTINGTRIVVKAKSI